MNDKYYGIYFDPSELEVNREGHLLNVDALQIIEFEYENEDSDEPTAMRRVDTKGNVITEGWDGWKYRDNLAHIGGRDDYYSMEDAFDDFYRWFSENREWRESSPQTYWQPAEYVCIGITGYCDDEKSYWHPARRYRHFRR